MSSLRDATWHSCRVWSEELVWEAAHRAWMGWGGTGSPNAGALERVAGSPPKKSRGCHLCQVCSLRCCLASRWRYDGYAQQHTTPSADGIGCIIVPEAEQFSHVFSRTVSKSLTSSSCFA